jgi:hypothetical protein
MVLVVDWELVQEIWEHALVRRLRVDPAERPLLVSGGGREEAE